MMPEMDGIEAVALIRDWEKQTASAKPVPIIALTANAVVGMREMFLGKGFDDFIAKPIDVSKLDELLERWIPEEKKEQMPANSGELIAGAKYNNSKIVFPQIPNVNIQYGIAMTGGTTENYLAVLTMFVTDAEERLSLFKTALNELNMPLFATHFHALKSATASIGTSYLSGKAAKLEAAAKTGDLTFVEKNIGEFSADLAELIANIQKAKTEYNASFAQNQNNNLSPLFLKPVLNELKTALIEKKASSEIFNILIEINKIARDSKHKEILDRVSYQVLMNEYDEAREALGELEGI